MKKNYLVIKQQWLKPLMNAFVPERVSLHLEAKDKRSFTSRNWDPDHVPGETGLVFVDYSTFDRVLSSEDGIFVSNNELNELVRLGQ